MPERYKLSCPVCQIRSRGIFTHLEGDNLSKLDLEKSVKKLRKGQIIFHEDTPALAIYCIHSGRVKLYKLGDKGEEQVIRLLGAGTIIGYRALLAQELFAATAEAVEETVVCVIPKDTILALIANSPEQALELMRLLSIELRISEEQLLQRTQESVRQRTARLILFLYEGVETDTKDNGMIPIPISRKEMSQMIGTTPETLSRILRRFVSDGLITLYRDGIRINNLPQLKKIARGIGLYT
ncbi:MAG: cyclic nucleotide-binding domain-containing protein [candidate division Zixibacteria bacterium]|nr:cyclic nucleotide-binding domain-containing protein [candidate division Zixibacteria bacterium]